MPLSIKAVTLRNFLSVGNATQGISLDRAGLTLVLGHNTDTQGGTTRNGAGKTTILQAIAYGIYGKPLTKIKIGNLCNNINNKAMLVTVDFERDGKSYRIERGQKPAILRFYVDGTETKPPSDEAQGENRHTQSEIDRIVGMSLGLFRHLVALNTFTPPFMQLSAAEQRALIEELNGTTALSARAETLKVLLVQTRERARDLEAQIQAVSASNARIEIEADKARDASQAWEARHEEAMEDLHAAIETLRAIDFEAEIAAFDALDVHAGALRQATARESALRADLTALRREIARHEREAASALSEATSDLSAAQVRRLQDEITRKDRDVARHERLAASLGETRRKLVSDRDGADTTACVCCGQDLVGTDHLATVLASLAEQIRETDETIRFEENEVRARKAEIAEISAEIVAVREAAETRRGALKDAAEASTREALGLRAEAERLDDALAAAGQEIADLGPAPRTLFRNRDEVYRAKQQHDTLVRDLGIEGSKENPYRAQVQSLIAAIQPIDYEPLHDAQSLFKHQDLLYRLLTSKDSFIRKRIVDQNLAYLNQRLAVYLDKLGLAHEVRFMPDLSVEITLLGKDYDFEQLSRGEMNRVIMATSWSFRDIWESLNTSLNLLWVDELLDQGTDTQGVEAAVAILKGMARDRGKNVFLISHRDELVSRIDSILLVSKENGFTSFQEDASL